MSYAGNGMSLTLLEAMRRLAAANGRRLPDEILREQAERALPWWAR